MAQRRRTKTGATEDEERHQIIPTDLHEEILLRLPANALLNLKRVCKDWLRLISSPRFIQKHINRSKAGCNGTRIIILSPPGIIDYNHYASGGKNISKKIPYPPGFSSENTRMPGSCDGLVCLVDTGSLNFALYNPSTGKSDVRKIDGVEFNRSCCYWFGHHPSTGDYVLVIGNSSLPVSLRFKIHVYNFSCKLKSVLSCSSRPPLFAYNQDIGTLLHGNLHWASVHGFSFIVSAYNFQKNKVLEISAPAPSFFTLGVVDGCLSAILNRKKVYELWIMKEYGVRESWTKYRNIEEYDYRRTSFPLRFSWNDIIIIETWNDGSKLIAIYSLRDEEATLLKVHESDNRLQAVVCIDSLVSPTLVWGE